MDKHATHTPFLRSKSPYLSAPASACLSVPNPRPCHIGHCMHHTCRSMQHAVLRCQSIGMPSVCCRACGSHCNLHLTCKFDPSCSCTRRSLHGGFPGCHAIYTASQTHSLRCCPRQSRSSTTWQQNWTFTLPWTTFVKLCWSCSTVRRLPCSWSLSEDKNSGACAH